MPRMFLNGGGMRGGSLHHLLAGAPLVAEISTAPRYLGMILRRPCPVIEDLTEITAFGGWRAYLSRLR